MTLGRQARDKVELGPVAAPYGADRERVVSVPNDALATELVCVLRYRAGATGLADEAVESDVHST